MKKIENNDSQPFKHLKRLKGPTHISFRFKGNGDYSSFVVLDAEKFSGFGYLKIRLMQCKNCGNKVNHQFCPLCGQNIKVRRINLSNFWDEVSGSILQIDRGFFYTLKELFVRPGAALKEYLEGKRKKHFKPIAYVLTLSTLYYLVATFLNENTWVDDVITGWMSNSRSGDFKEETSSVIVWFSKNYAYLVLVLLPLFSLASYLSFYRYKLSYLEHIVINSYITGQQAIIYLIFALLIEVLKFPIIQTISILVAFGYTLWVFYQFFSTGNRLINIIRSVFTYAVYLVFSVLLLGSLLVISRLE